MGNTNLVTVYVAPDRITAELICGLLISEGLHAFAGEDYRAHNFGMSMHEVGVPLAEKVPAEDIVAAWVESRKSAS